MRDIINLTPMVKESHDRGLILNAPLHVPAVGRLCPGGSVAKIDNSEVRGKIIRSDGAEKG